MTVCLAAIADDQSIVTVSDLRVSTGYTSSRVGTIKLLPIHVGWYVMYAGKVSHCLGVIGNIQLTLSALPNPPTDEDVMNAATNAFVAYSNKLAYERVLSPYGLDMQTFKQSRADLGDALYERIWSEIGRIKADCDLIVFGFDKNRLPSLFIVSNPTDDHPSFVTHCAVPGFACIGSGGYISESILHGFEQFAGDSSEKTVYQLCCAKFTAESATDVGDVTYVKIFYPDGSTKRLSGIPIDQKLRAEWELHVRPKVRDEGLKELAKDIATVKPVIPDFPSKPSGSMENIVTQSTSQMSKGQQ
jgi:hypothetical protein